ncbi:MAG: hydroxyacid dehydrogenase, partial [Arthrobacter sp.]|nr:hydroxyacid dehydrogenase [Arthrobacter sp.]
MTPGRPVPPPLAKPVAPEAATPEATAVDGGRPAAAYGATSP